MDRVSVMWLGGGDFVPLSCSDIWQVVTVLFACVCTVCAAVTKQYNLVLPKCTDALHLRKIITGIAEINSNTP